MKKLFTLVLSLAFININAENSVTIIQGVGNDAYYATGMSSDGEYITGQVGDQHHMFVWKRGEALAIERDDNRLSGESQGGSNARGVSITGRVAGICPNPDLYYYDENYFYGGGESNIVTAAVFDYETETWTFLPIVTNPDRNLVPTYGSRSYAISDDGKIIVGGQNPGGESPRFIAGFWKETDSEDIIYTPLSTDVSSSHGSVAKALSGDGSIIGGFKSAHYNSYIPVLWIDTEKTGNYIETSIPGATNGSVESISNNGKYAVLTVLIGGEGIAYLYNMEENSLVEITSQPSAALSVSDNGVVVGHWGGLYYAAHITANNFSYGRHIQDANGAFIFTESAGVKGLKDFFDEEGITYPEEFNFKAATAISSDGKLICGHGILEGKGVSFQVEIPEITSAGVFSARNLKIGSPAYASIQLEWEAVPENPNFVGYKIYSDKGSLLHTTSATETSFTFTEVEDGTYSYYVVASYAGKEAPATKTLTITVGKTDYPVFEPFDYLTEGRSPEILRTKYWDISTNDKNNTWELDPNSGLPAGSGAIRFLTPIGGEYSESLSSPYFDATESADLYLSFVLSVPEGLTGAAEQKLAVEVFDGAEWSTLDVIPAVEGELVVDFKLKEYELSQLAHKDNVRFRLRCFGTANSLDLSWIIDNLEFTDEPFPLDPPSALSVRSVPEEETVHVNWSDPNGHILLRYMMADDLYDGVGNAGEPFLAANMYPAEDLQMCEGYKLTSLSFYRFTTPEELLEAPITVQPEYKWYVSQGEERLLDLAVIDPQLGWNTIELSEPIPIDINKALYYGVEIVKHDPLDWPMGVGVMYSPDFQNKRDTALTVAYGRANLLSYDEGETWTTLAEQGVEYALFYVQATLAKDPAIPPKERVLGYKIFRNGVNLLEEEFGPGKFTRLNNYTDRFPLIGKEACYTIYTEYFSLALSDGITECITINGIDLIETSGGLKIYPNLVGSNETIRVTLSGEWEGAVVELYDLSGKKIKTIKATGQTTPIQLNVEAGIYLLKVNNKESVKLIVK
ncbi:MAG: T9SS type A sorting domain-containing protein [Dysgonamonadaceae bacterium]|jgi:hypothetical protein|nr:T9SS type A sorting domain-containing protein [Dysgonamonadaceae bacterium]